MNHRTSKYGLDERTGPPVRRACEDLSRVINTLQAHHVEELPAMDEAVAAFVVELDALPDDAPGRELVITRARDVETAVITMRSQRGALLGHLLALRPALVDVIFEAHTLGSPDAVPDANVEAHTTLPAPKPLDGLKPDADDRLRILDKTLKWSRQATYGHAVMALGPCHLLSQVIADPAPEAQRLSGGLAEAGERPAASSSGPSSTENPRRGRGDVRR